MHICYKKGPRGSPTYDGAGFQLDYDEVADWMKPRAYNKKSMVGGMGNASEEGGARKSRDGCNTFRRRKGTW